MQIQLTPKTRRQFQNITYLFLGLTVLAIIGTLIAWVISEPGSFEPLNALFFAIFPILTAILAWLSRPENVAIPQNVATAEYETIPLGPLRRQIADSFNLDELRTLCLDIGIKYDSLRGETMEEKTASLVAYMQRRSQLTKLMAELERERPTVNWPMPTQLEQQFSLRRNVRATWVEGVLKQSVTDEIAIELDLTYQPHTLTRKVSYVPGQTERFVEKSIPDLFSEYGSLLILGEPGSGKTMTLLQLTESLLDAAEADATKPTPVVVNLSSWAQQQDDLGTWLVEELLLQYQLPRETGNTLITSGHLIYLLDGLDEVAADARDACVQAINSFQARQSTQLVVCCRVTEYEALSEKLNLGMGIRIEPLRQTQVEAYLSRPELELKAVEQMVQTDEALCNLAKTPLFLSVMTLAYRGMTRSELSQLDTLDARRNHLYNQYVTEMWQRRPLTGQEGYIQPQAMIWLTNLAYGLQQEDQTIFYIEHLQATWLLKKWFRRRFYWINGFSSGLFIVLYSFIISSLIIGLFGGLVDVLINIFTRGSYGEKVGFLVGLIGLILGGLLGLLWGVEQTIEESQKPIEIYDELHWTPPPLIDLLKERKDTLLMALFFGSSVGLLIGFLFGIYKGLIGGLLMGLFILIIANMYSFVGVSRIVHPLQPNQGICNSWLNNLLITMINVYLNGLLFGLLFGLFNRGLLGLLIGLLIGLLEGQVNFGGSTKRRHYVLRWLLAKQGTLPYPFKDELLVAYLDAMADRIFLRRVGGGWVFIHRTLLDYFASLHPSAAVHEL